MSTRGRWSGWLGGWREATVETPVETPAPIARNERGMHGEVWTTADECAFVRGLGSHWRAIPGLPLSRVELLRRYLAAASRRVVWGGIDRAECVKLAHALLADEVIAARRARQ